MKLPTASLPGKGGRTGVETDALADCEYCDDRWWVKASA
jgi:hypothetical protein